MNNENTWHLDPRRAPALKEDDELIRSEHGRVAFNIDYRSHWFILVKNRYRYAVLVRHGGGNERIELPTVNTKVIVNIIASLSSDEAYLMMHHLFDIHRDATTEARKAAAKEYREAFVDGRLKKRKLPAQGVTKVWIEDKPLTHWFNGETGVDWACRQGQGPNGSTERAETNCARCLAVMETAVSQ